MQVSSHSHKLDPFLPPQLIIVIAFVPILFKRYFCGVSRQTTKFDKSA